MEKAKKNEVVRAEAVVRKFFSLGTEYTPMYWKYAKRPAKEICNSPEMAVEVLGLCAEKGLVLPDITCSFADGTRFVVGDKYFSSFPEAVVYAASTVIAAFESPPSE